MRGAVKECLQSGGEVRRKRVASSRGKLSRGACREEERLEGSGWSVIGVKAGGMGRRGRTWWRPLPLPSKLAGVEDGPGVSLWK